MLQYRSVECLSAFFAEPIDKAKPAAGHPLFLKLFHGLVGGRVCGNCWYRSDLALQSEAVPPLFV